MYVGRALEDGEPGAKGREAIESSWKFSDAYFVFEALELSFASQYLPSTFRRRSDHSYVWNLAVDPVDAKRIAKLCFLLRQSCKTRIERSIPNPLLVFTNERDDAYHRE
jgi:hypothetical protein